MQSARFKKIPGTIFTNFCIAGGFAYVARADLDDSRVLGIRFLRSEQLGISKRYKMLPAVFARSGLNDYTVNVSLKSNELILPSGKWDIIEMEWINGTTLGGEIKQLVEQRDSNGIRRLSEKFEKLARTMVLAEVSHGDISPENLMVRSGQIVLIDYDSFWSKELAKMPCPVGATKLQHPDPAKTLGRLADRVAFAIFKLGFSVLIENTANFTSKDACLEGHRFVFDVDSLSKGDPSVKLIPDREKPLYELLMSVLGGSYERVEELDDLLFPELRTENSLATVGSVQNLKATFESTQKDSRLKRPEIIHLVTITTEHSLSLRSLRERLAQVGVPVYSNVTEHILLEHWALVKDVVTGAEETAELKKISMIVSTDTKDINSKSTGKTNKTKISELAKSLGMTNAEMLALCKANNVRAKTPQSTIVEAFIPMLKRKAQLAGLVREVVAEKAHPVKKVSPNSEASASFTTTFGLSRERYLNVVGVLFPGQDSQSVPSDSVKALLDLILPIAEWKNLRKYSGSRIKLDGKFHSLNDVAKVLHLGNKYLRAMLVLEGLVHVPYNGQNNKYFKSQWAVWLHKIGVTVEGYVPPPPGRPMGATGRPVPPPPGRPMSATGRPVPPPPPRPFVYCDCGDHRCGFRPGWTVSSPSRPVPQHHGSYHSGSTPPPLTWSRMIRNTDEWVPIEYALEFRRLPKEKYLNVLNRLFPGAGSNSVMITGNIVKSLETKMNEILPIHEWSDVQKFSGLTIKLNSKYLTIEDISKIIGIHSSYLRALLLLEGVVYVYPDQNGHYPSSQWTVWLQKIGITVDGDYSEQFLKSRPPPQF